MTHIPVLKDETIDGLLIKEGETIVDGTLGGGGHTKEIIKRFRDKVKIIGLDLDEDAIERVKNEIKKEKANIIFVNAGFQDIDEVLKDLKENEIDKILLDLGISSFQLEESGRGFSFQKDEPLLMTMKKSLGKGDLTASVIINNWDEKSIADIIYELGEEKYSRKIAKAIVDARLHKEIKTTAELAEIIYNTVGRNYKGLRIHPATRTFQALRIATNGELSNLDRGIRYGFENLKTGGRMAIISFHSLEDRIVKRKFVNLKNEGRAKILTKKPILPKDYETKINPRARSAKLRIIEKLI